MTALLVEDDEQQAARFEATLRSADHEARPGVDLQVVDRLTRARRRLASVEIDVVLLDLTLSDTQGLEGLQELLTHHPQVPIVVLTSEDDGQQGVLAVELGAQDFLVKGRDDGPALANRIEFAIQRHALHRDRELARELLQHRTEQLEEASRLRERLIEVVSHELRTPLTPLLGFSRLLLKRREGMADRDTDLLLAIERNAQRLLDRVDDLLTVGRARHGRLETSSDETTTLRGVLQTVAEQDTGTLEQVEVSGSLDTPIAVDHTHLEQMLENLVTNARKYGTPPIRVHAQPDTDELLVTVTDQGPGIPPQFVAAMWEPFSQAHESPRAPSTGVGLGLAIVRLLAEANSIEVTYDATTGAGAAFHLRIPMTAGPADREAAPDHVSDPGHLEHQVALYQSEEFLTTSIVNFLVPGLQTGEAAVIVATPEHRARFAMAFEAHGIDVDAAVADDRLIMLDAAATLSRLRVDRALDHERFHILANDLLDRAATSGRDVRLWGEMVSLLWNEGAIADALLLETLWADLQRARPVRLACGYEIHDAAHPAVAQLRDLHTEDHTEARCDALVAATARQGTAVATRRADQFEPPAPGQPAMIDGAVVATGATRQLLHAETPDEVREILLQAVHALGGTTTISRDADDDAIPVDLALGGGEPLLPVAPRDSVARMHLERHLPALVADARQALDSIARRERLSRDAAVDSLTRLGNRATFARLLSRLVVDDVVVALDLDGFKGINDTHGHAAGDEVLRSFAACLRDHLRAGDHAARIGGDEFALVLTDTDIDGARQMLERFRAAWQQRRTYPVDFSAGVTTNAGAGAATHELADQALYAAKAAGKGRTIVGGADTTTDQGSAEDGR